MAVVGLPYSPPPMDKRRPPKMATAEYSLGGSGSVSHGDETVPDVSN